MGCVWQFGKETALQQPVHTTFLLAHMGMPIIRGRQLILAQFIIFVPPNTPDPVLLRCLAVPLLQAPGGQFSPRGASTNRVRSR
jgi:hypothetical protein